MKSVSPYVILIILFSFIGLNSYAQSKGTKSKTTKKTTQPATKTTPAKTTPATKQTTKTEAPKTDATKASADPLKNEQKVRDMVAFLEYILNSIGSATTANSDKDVLITESYTKIFRDGKVQVEDDLVGKRDVITNKDVPAYLKDVDFFFKDIKFEFAIENIQGGTNANNKLFYKVSTKRNIKGIDLDGKTVNNTIPRFIEINYDPKDQDLKIVSIYTNEVDETEALNSWWKQLSYEWQAIFKKKLNLADSVQLSDIKNITALEELDLSGNTYIKDLEPLSRLSNLRILNIAGSSLTDLNAVRNLTELEELNISNTAITDISALRYSDKLKKLIMNRTQVNDLTVFERLANIVHLEMEHVSVNDISLLGGLSQLQFLDIKGTPVGNLSALEPLTTVTELNVSGTAITDLNAVKNYKNLSVLYVDSTSIKDLIPLTGVAALKELHMNYTTLSNLEPLKDLVKLERIYCDHSQVTRSIADTFMAANPGVLVILDSEDLKNWWNALPDAWHAVFTKAAKVNANPTKEELARVTNLDSINLSGIKEIQDADALSRLLKLKSIVANKSALRDISAWKDLKNVRYIDISETAVNDLSVLGQFSQLKVLKADRTKVQSIASLAGLPKLERVYVDETAVKDAEVQEFLKKSSNTLVVYKTSEAENWWTVLPDEWKKTFQTRVTIDQKTKRENLHQLIELEAVNFKEASVNDLSVFSMFVRLKEIRLSGTSVSDISPLGAIKNLKVLQISDSPLGKLDPISQLTNLEEVDISNTPVEDINPLYSLQNLKKLNCAGTQVKKLDVLEKIKELQSLDCSNTLVKSLDPVMNLPLNTLKCYNTKISSKKAQEFKTRHADCNVTYY